MQTFENILLQNYLTEFYDIAHTHGPWVCVIKVCSNGGATYIKIINLFMPLMRIKKNFLYKSVRTIKFILHISLKIHLHICLLTSLKLTITV